ncbi:MAG: precorrin-2 C(20)-methyltransferase [Geminicoccaceae bacterium]
MITGRLIGVGVGPGDPDLLTIKAVKAIRSAPIIAYVSANGGASMARQIVAEHLTGKAKEIKFTLPMSPMPELAQAAYDEGASRIGAELEQGTNVVALCEGDPMFYGSFGHIFQRLADQYPTEIIPGVSSIMAAAATAKQPLAFGQDCVAVIPATLPEALFKERLQTTNAAVILKIGRHVEKVRSVLEQLDLIQHATYVERASSAEEKVIPLADLDQPDVPYFSLIIVSKHHR